MCTKIKKIRFRDYLGIWWSGFIDFGIIRIASSRGFEWRLDHVSSINIDRVTSLWIFKYILIDFDIQWSYFIDFGVIRIASSRGFEWWLDHVSSINIDRITGIQRFIILYIKNFFVKNFLSKNEITFNDWYKNNSVKWCILDLFSLPPLWFHVLYITFDVTRTHIKFHITRFCYTNFTQNNKIKINQLNLIKTCDL